MTVGKVYLVGAGPGHPELLTLKAAALLKTCDVIVYDRLIQEEVLALAKPSSERIFMGKAPGRHKSRQEEIHQLLAQKAREGRTVVRLKGGDPFLFGRGGEEAEFLADHGIPFEVVPGVSSALAAPLSAGIAVTHRDLASAVAIVTGHEAAQAGDRLDWEALSRIDTLVFLMAVANVTRICERLIANGKRPETPAAMIQMAYWHDERVVTATLGSIASAVERADITPPATLVIGDVVTLREKLRHSHRDLQRRRDGGSRFAPAPAADQVLSLATGAIGSQLLGFALEARVFDWLEQPRTPGEVAARFGLDTAELLDPLVAMGLVESTAEGYRNREIASRYLMDGSDQSLRPALLEQIALSTSWTHISECARPRDAAVSGVNGRRWPMHASREALARFTAPAVVEKIDLGGSGPILHIGSGGAAFGDAIARRWPGLSFTTCDPFLTTDPVAAIERARGPFGAALLSDVFTCCDRGEIERLLAAATELLGEPGVLVLHDAFVPGVDLAPAHVVLGGFARHLAHRNGGMWSSPRVAEVLDRFGWTMSRIDPVIAGTLLVTANRRAHT